jgi:Ca-activated chloride channel homolog
MTRMNASPSRRAPTALLAILSLGLLMTSPAASAQTAPHPLLFPRIVVPPAEAPITLGSLDVRVLVDGLHARTETTAVLHNPNGRVLEGELEFPLPDGASVCGFALDVGGQLVDGVVVPKEEARVALETEIRKGVDPGLVEQVRGNLYRARVYPIPAHGTRTVRLAWVSRLATKGSEARLVVPLQEDVKVGEVALRVEVARAAGLSQPVFEGGFGPLAQQAWEDRWVAEARFAGAAAKGDLVVRLPQLPAQIVSVEALEGGEEAYFSAGGLLPERASQEVPAPQRLALAWDASGSRTQAAVERELQLLSALLEKWPQAAVDLVVFRDRPERPRAFAAAERAKLFEALRSAPLDGATALSALDLSAAALPHPQDALWLLCSDGLATLGEALPKRGGARVVTLSAAAVADRALLRALSDETGGAFVDLSAGGLDVPSAISLLTRSRLRLVEVQARPAGAASGLHLTPLADPLRAEVTGRLLAPEAELTLVYGGLTGPVEKRVVLLSRAQARKARERGPGPVAIAWAQDELERLAIFEGKSREALLSLGRKFGLVTSSTSLLVLETLEQHLTYGVEPAATRPELLASYRAEASRRSQQEKQQVRQHLDEVASLWEQRKEWWSKRYDVPEGFRYQEEPKKKSSRSRDGLFDVAPGAPPPAPMMSMAAGAAAPMAERAMPKESEGAGPSNTASIAIQPWDPQVPYLIPLRTAEKGHAYEAYLRERQTHQSPAFFLDCAELLLRLGEKELGLRVLSNLAELRLDDPALLRVLAWRLSQAGELQAAEELLEKVLRLRPEEPQSRRDLALVLAERAEQLGDAARAVRAVGLLYEVVQRPWDRFPEIELIALMELNRTLVRGERRGWAGALEGARAQVDKRLLGLLDVDLRVSLSWDADLTDVDLHVFEPTGEHAFFSHNRTTIGGLVSRDLTQGYGPEEYLLRRALPGKYEVKVHYYGSRQQKLVGPATMIATVFTHWGRADEKKEILTLRLDSPKDLELVGVVTIGK